MIIDNLFKHKKTSNKETKILKKGGQIMNKNLFKKVICFVIALMMVMPNMPATVMAYEPTLIQDEVLETKEQLPEDDMQLEEPEEEGPPKEESPAEEPSVEEPLVEEPTAEEPPVEEPPIEEPPVEEPPVEEPPVEEPPVEEPPVAGEVLVEKSSLKIEHILLRNGEEESLFEKELEDLDKGSIITGNNLVDEELLMNNFQFMYSDPNELVIGDDNLIKLYYEIEMGDNLDGLSGPKYIDSPDLIEYFKGELGPLNDKKLMKRNSLLFTGKGLLSDPSDYNNIEPPAPGSLDINKEATPVEGYTNRWKVELTLAGKDIPRTSDIVLVIDRSGSMEGDKLTAAKNAATSFVNTLLDDVTDTSTRIAVVSFAGDVTVHVDASQPFRDATNKQPLLDAIDGIDADGGTHTQAGIRQANILLNGSSADYKNIVLLSDGQPTYSYGIIDVNDKLNPTYFVNTSGSTWHSRDDLDSSVFNYSTTIGSGGSLTQYIGYSTNPFGLYYYNNGNSAVAESRFAKIDKTVYTIALDAGDTGNDVLSRVASPGKAFTGTSGDLENIFQTIAGSISYAATDATITDPMGEMFNIPGINASNYETYIHVNRGTVSWNDSTETITWTLPTISEGNPATMWYEVEIEPTAVSGQVYPTNEHTYVGYTNANGEDAQKSFPIPEAGIDAGTIKIHYYRVNAAGQPINSTGEPVTKEQAELQVLTYLEGTSLELNVPYSVSGPQTVDIGGINYEYNDTNNGGDTNPTSVTLTTAQPSQHVWFAYTQIIEGPPITVTGYTGVYDGVSYSITVTNTITGDTVWYSTNGGTTWSETNPGYTNVGVYTVDVKVTNPNYVNRTGTGTVTITPKVVTLKSKDLSKPYDGEALTNGSEPLETETGWVTGEGATYSFTGSQTEVGYSPNKFDYTLNTGTLADNYTIDKTEGTLTVTSNGKEIKVTAVDNSWTYDGNNHSDGSYKVTYGSEEYIVAAGESATLSTGDTVTAVITGTVKDVSDTASGNNVVTSVTVTNSEGYGTVTKINGTLTITKREVTLKSKDLSKMYDGTALTNESEPLETETGWVTGEGATYSFTGSQTEVGYSPNKFDYTLNDGTLLGNYDISKVEGTLTVTEPLPIDIIVSKDWNDNGQEGPAAFSIEETAKPDITFRLWIGEEQVDSLTLKNGETMGTFKDKPAYDSEYKKIVYTITEDEIPGYDALIEGPYEDGNLYVHVTNTIKWFKVNYDANGGSGIMTDENSPYKYGTQVTVLPNTLFTRSNYRFTGWNTQADGNGTSYAAGATFAMPAHDVTLYAQWSRKDDGGGGGGTVIPDPKPPVAELEKFDHFAYVIGYPEGDVRPLNNITREEVAMIFYRLLTDESRNALLSDVNPFTDMEGHTWSNRAISTLYNAGILSGYPDGTFKPSAPITRAEFATIAAKFDKLELGSASNFTDIFGHWAEKYITSSEIKGWIKGYPDLTFKPDKDITRAEAMTLINNVLERAVPAENIHPDAKFWPDNPSKEWYYEAVMEATNSHDYIYEDDKDELWTGMKPNKVWP